MVPFGFLNCNKPPGVTSRDVVNLVQRRWRGVKFGHAGTLDPLADGVLVVGVGRAVRLVPYVQQMPKEYAASFRLGAMSASGDIEQPIIEHEDLPLPRRDQLEQAARSMIGTIRQTPPAYSAIKIGGRRAYEMVRKGEQVEMPPRTVVVYEMRITAYEPPNLDVVIVCGSGTYIRSIGIDLAHACGNVAVMTSLTRTSVGPFALRNATTWEQLAESELESLLGPASDGVVHLPRLIVDEDDIRRLEFGQRVSGVCEPASRPELSGSDADDETAAAIDRQGRLRAIIEKRDDQWKPVRVFPIDPE